MPTKLKPFTEYLRSTPHEGIGSYSQYPVPEFLRQVVDIADAVAHCVRNFPRKKDGSFTAASSHSHLQLSAGSLCTIMGHFELYQRFSFAGLVEHSVQFIGFDLHDAVRRLKNSLNFQMDPMRVLAYRGRRAVVGQMIVDSLPGWHNPEHVNGYFKAFLPKLNFYSNDQIIDLRVLWQLRHTMAHTGGWLTLPDAQRLLQLWPYRNEALYFEPRFIEAVVRRFHRIAPASTRRLKQAFDLRASPAFTASNTYQHFFRITSPRLSWL